ncbi:MAG TPA: HSP90 family protein [Candidatus Ruthenibacterium avium]|uniref:HSP90 family protein n=1 Tax=Candidatus Ruthenibacterium avium TaxID=2838751 RepID=A0A9D2M293_9FIRM|nr:HSP90 family protein [Candidatus Ruthenibacterium avium]
MMNDVYHFQVNLGGMLDILSNHLYKSPDVFLRELMQNGIDAITMRRKQDPNWKGGQIAIQVEPGESLMLQDNGAALSEEGIHRFLAVIGQSSKTELVNGKLPEDYIGRFGIGLLSCFMVSDSIVVHTRPAQGGPAHVWTGYPDGTYTLQPLEDCPVGTTIILTAKPGMERYFQASKIEELVRYYGLALPVPIYLNGSTKRINSLPSDFSGVSREQLLSFGEWVFQEKFLEAIPIRTPHLSGAAYVLPYRTDQSVKNSHRIYLKQMLLTENGERILPPWAFFLRCFLNTRNLRPTASREDFYEDEALDEARQEFVQVVRAYLANLAKKNPERLRTIVEVHEQAIKAMAVWDEELFRIFIDYLSFETSEGILTGAALKQAEEAFWVHSVPRYQQLRSLFLAQGRLLICTGYVSDQELIEQLAKRFQLPIHPLREEDMETVLNEVTSEEKEQAETLLNAADNALQAFDCRTQLCRFLPADLPALYALSDQVQFLRQVQSAQESSTGVFSDALACMLEGIEEKPLASLYLNANNTLIRRLMHMQDEALLRQTIKILYVQSLLAGGHSVQGEELRALNGGLMMLLERISYEEWEQENED